MLGEDVCGGFEVVDVAADFQYPVVGAGGKALAGHGLLQHPLALGRAPVGKLLEADGGHAHVGAYFQTRLAYTMAAFNVLVQWHGLEPEEHGKARLSITEFSL